MARNQAKTKFRITRQQWAQACYQQWEKDLMMRGNTTRWNWLMETFKGLPPEEQSNIRLVFADRYDSAGRPDDQVMYEIMIEFGIVLKGVDPRPPPKVYVTDAGALEYEEILLVQEIGEDL